MADNAYIRWRGGGPAAFVMELKRRKEQTRDAFFDHVERAATLGKEKTEEVANERRETGEMSGSVDLEVTRSENKISARWGWLGGTPRYTWFQEFGTYDNHISPRRNPLPEGMESGGRGIAPMEALARGLMRAEQELRRG